MSDTWVLIIVAIVVILGGYLLSYRSGQHRLPRKDKEDKTKPE